MNLGWRLSSREDRRRSLRRKSFLLLGETMGCLKAREKEKSMESWSGEEED